MKEFIWPVRVYYEDTDCGGVVYHSNYLKFMERARTEWLRQLGIEQDELRQQGVLFVVRHIQIDFLKPAGFNQRLDVSVKPEKVGGASLLFEQKIKSAEDQTIICRADVKVACVNAEAMRPCPVPAHICREILE